MDTGYIVGCNLELRNGFGNMLHPFLKFLKGTFLGTPRVHYSVYLFLQPSRL